MLRTKNGNTTKTAQNYFSAISPYRGLGIIGFRLLLSPSVSGLQSLLRTCEMAIQEIDMEINAAKTVCMRIGSRYNATCASLTLCNGTQLQ